MNIKNIILLIGLLLVWTACKKKKTEEAAPKQYSTWIVNNHDTFRTNNVDSSIDCNPDHSYCRAVLTSLDPDNWYTLGFALDYLPTNGYYLLDTNALTPGSIQFYYNNVFYYHTPNKVDTLYTFSTGSKIGYILPSSWFVNYDNPTGDSILIQGTFNLP